MTDQPEDDRPEALVEHVKLVGLQVATKLLSSPLGNDFDRNLEGAVAALGLLWLREPERGALATRIALNLLAGAFLEANGPLDASQAAEMQAGFSMSLLNRQLEEGGRPVSEQVTDTAAEVGANVALALMVAPDGEYEDTIRFVASSLLVLQAGDPQAGAIATLQALRMLADAVRQGNGGPLTDEQSRTAQAGIVAHFAGREFARDGDEELKNLLNENGD